MIANIKKLLGKVPGGKTRLASYAAALFLIKEYKHFSDDSLLTEDLTDEQLDESLALFEERYIYYNMLAENVNENIHPDMKNESELDELSLSLKDLTKSGINKKGYGDKDKIKKDLEKLRKGLKKEDLDEARKPAPVRWKRAGANGEIQATIGGKKYQIEKALDHNERHKGEWKVMVWDKRRESWEWETTEYGKSNAKAWIMDRMSDEAPANNVGGGNIAGMDGSAFSKAAQKKWTSRNKSKKKKLRDMLGDLQ